MIETKEKSRMWLLIEKGSEFPVGYSHSKKDLEDIIKLCQVGDADDCYVEYDHEDLSVVDIWEVYPDKKLLENANNRKFVNYEEVVIEILLNEDNDEKGDFAYFENFTKIKYRNILENDVYERFNFFGYSFSNRKVRVKVQSKDCYAVLDMVRGWKDGYKQNGLQWLLDTIGEHRKFG